jgi:prophage pi2 protein 38
MMTLQELYTQLKTLQLPVQYYMFQEGQAPTLPYIIYFNPSEQHANADNFTWHISKDVIVEVYSEFKDLSLEDKMKQLFDKNKLTYTFQEIYLKDERMYMLAYQITL